MMPTVNKHKCYAFVRHTHMHCCDFTLHAILRNFGQACGSMCSYCMWVVTSLCLASSEKGAIYRSRIMLVLCVSVGMGVAAWVVNGNVPSFFYVSGNYC